MKHIKKFYENKRFYLDENKDIKEIEELCIHLKDEVNKVEISPNGSLEINGKIMNQYNIEIVFSRDDAPVHKIIENAEKMLEITKEYVELIEKLQDVGYKLEYHLLQTSQHLNFYSLTGKIQLRKAN